MTDDLKFMEVLSSVKISRDKCKLFGCHKSSHLVFVRPCKDFHDPNINLIGYTYKHGVKTYIWNDEWYYQSEIPKYNKDYIAYKSFIETREMVKYNAKLKSKNVEILGPTITHYAFQIKAQIYYCFTNPIILYKL